MATIKHNEEALQELFKLIIERKEGYQMASEYVDDDELSELFDSYVKQCEDFALELAPYDSKIEKNIMVVPGIGNSRKVWTEMKGALTSGEPKGILDSCVSGEESVLTKYTEIIEDENFPEDLYNIVEQQKLKIEKAFESIKIQLNAI